MLRVSPSQSFRACVGRERAHLLGAQPDAGQRMEGLESAEIRRGIMIGTTHGVGTSEVSSSVALVAEEERVLPVGHVRRHASVSSSSTHQGLKRRHSHRPLGSHTFRMPYTRYNASCSS